jgi:hypothetical protein
MPFGLKNVGATLQRCMQFYVNDIVVKSQKSDNLIFNLEEIFNILWQFNIKLKSKKCTFGVPWGKLLLYIITERGIEANPDKISAIAEMRQVRNVKDVQWLMGCIASLSHFMSRLGSMGSPCINC